MDHCRPPVTPRPRHPCNMQAPIVHCLTYQFMRSTFVQVCSSTRLRLRSMLMRGYGFVRSNVHVSLVFTASINWANIPFIISNITPRTLYCHLTLTFVFPKDKASHPRLKGSNIFSFVYFTAQLHLALSLGLLDRKRLEELYII